MIKVLAFLEADLPRVEKEINLYMDKYEISYVYSTASRLIFILKEKEVKRSHHKQANKEES